MIMLVTLQQAKDHLRVDNSDGDADLTLKIAGASAAIQNYLKDPLLAYEWAEDEYSVPFLDTAGDEYLAIDSAGDYIVRPEVQAAVLMMVGVLYIDRDAKAYVDGDGRPRLGDVSLPQAVHWILDPLRVPSLA